MMRFTQLHERGVPVRTIAACVAVLCCTVAVMAQPPDAATTLAAYKQTAELIIVLLGAGGLVTAFIWSFFNQKNHDKLNETIADQKNLLEARKERIESLNTTITELNENHRLMLEGMMAKHQLELNECRTDARNRQASNVALVDQNLTMKAILKTLSKEGKWEGNEFITIHDSKD